MSIEIKEALTYDDILLVPQISEVVPSEIQTSTYFAKDLKLQLPIISAAMDTVTEYQTAIVMAQEGGIGVIHKNMPIKEQAKHVQSMKSK